MKLKWVRRQPLTLRPPVLWCFPGIMTHDRPDLRDPADPPPILGDDFSSRAVERIRIFMIAIAVVLTAPAWWVFGHGSALGFVVGCVIAYLSFHWLKGGVSGLADRVTSTAQPQSGKGIVLRFVLRYVLMVAVAYGILISFPASLGGLFAGLFLPVGGIACEALYELYVTLVRRY